MLCCVIRYRSYGEGFPGVNDRAMSSFQSPTMYPPRCLRRSPSRSIFLLALSSVEMVPCAFNWRAARVGVEGASVERGGLRAPIVPNKPWGASWNRPGVPRTDYPPIHVFGE